MMLQSCWRLACAWNGAWRASFLGGRAKAEAAGQQIDRVHTKIEKVQSTRPMCVVRVEAQASTLTTHMTQCQTLKKIFPFIVYGSIIDIPSALQKFRGALIRA